MKTVCVVTWYKSNNFGTCLQAVALVKALEEMGYKCYNAGLWQKIYTKGLGTDS